MMYLTWGRQIISWNHKQLEKAGNPKNHLTLDFHQKVLYRYSQNLKLQATRRNTAVYPAFFSFICCPLLLSLVPSRFLFQNEYRTVRKMHNTIRGRTEQYSG